MAYHDAFQRIVNFVIALRPNEPLGIHEYQVTRDLAGPFTPGGLLVLLQEPRRNHPWSHGVDQVVSQCASLDILREGLRTVSSGRLSITRNVSVIDRWPFLHRQLHSDLETTRPADMTILDRMVADAIRTKQPDVILCMGASPRQFLEPHLMHLVPTPGTTIRVVYAMHPSLSANHEKDCLRRRSNLFGAILKAYSFVNPGLHLPQPVLEGLPPSGTRGAAQASTEEIRAIQDLLGQLAQLCMPPGCELPMTCLSPQVRPSYFVFRSRRQQEDLQHAHLCLGGRWQHDPRRSARAALIPTLMSLNGALVRTTYFVAGYRIDWAALLATLAAAPHTLEDLLLEAGGWDSRYCRRTGVPPAAAVAGGSAAAMRWIMDVLNLRQKLQCRPLPEPVDGQFGIRYNTCKCTTWFQYGDQRLQEAFRVVPTHDCASCGVRDERFFTRTVGHGWVSGLHE